MGHKVCCFIWMLSIMSGLSACALFHTTKEEDRVAVCNQLKHELMWNGANGSQRLWNGATGDQMLPTEQRAETETLVKNYHAEGCD